MSVSWAILPRHRITFNLDMLSISSERNDLQLFISEPIGLFLGGTQRTAFVILTLFNRVCRSH
ncbi:MAG: hypothetical protein CM15mP117_21100 [Alphaproteobacteria bacterium]|nr:MAG: hypothetical protein CM15mP117_21100 [Alphaproteobacteria bacterium]